jgi:hypothetical protein
VCAQSGLAAPDHTVPYGTVPSTDAFRGTSCQATIVLSLRDALSDILQTGFTYSTCTRPPPAAKWIHVESIAEVWWAAR